MKIDYNQIIDEYCLFDNDFMRLCFKEKPECVEFILKIILPQIAGLKVTKIKSEYEIDSLISHAVCLDAYAVDEKGTMYDIEVQRDDNIDKYGILYCSSIRCAKTVFPVWDAPVIRITIFVTLPFYEIFRALFRHSIGNRISVSQSPFLSFQGRYSISRLQ